MTTTTTVYAVSHQAKNENSCAFGWSPVKSRNGKRKIIYFYFLTFAVTLSCNIKQQANNTATATYANSFFRIKTLKANKNRANIFDS